MFTCGCGGGGVAGGGGCCAGGVGALFSPRDKLNLRKKHTHNIRALISFLVPFDVQCNRQQQSTAAGPREAPLEDLGRLVPCSRTRRQYLSSEGKEMTRLPAYYSTFHSRE